MALNYSRETEYQAIRAFIKVIGSPKSRMEHLLALAVEEELTPRQREVVNFYYIQQVPMKQISEQLGVSVSTVSRTLKRARTRLHRCLKYTGKALFSDDDDYYDEF